MRKDNEMICIIIYPLEISSFELVYLMINIETNKNDKKMEFDLFYRSKIN